ncbi:hypothetical protein [Bifidobacterium choloepi]|uniref:Uncharacterized protein n=1 Tax=Bifidobacterium choloepi TaxID=2614131 RepID=A0A6I5N1I5_9BIFI|nr:hypothetical protein [Bifidobacterium choloepi]NEG70336.1 hypothetical protein [Bifidobacterium choloepi]
MLTIREHDLKLVLANRKNMIGLKPVWENVLTIIAGIFYLPEALAVENCVWRIVLFAVGVIVVGYGVIGLCCCRYTTKTLYKEIAAMNIVSSSIVAMRKPLAGRSNELFVYWDEGWGCWFFPNRRSTPDIEDDSRDLINYLNTQFDVPVGDCTLHLKTTGEESKKSTEHGGELRHYAYRFYEGNLSSMPSSWESSDTEFEVAGHRCRWMTLDAMLADPVINQRNHYVIATVRDNL